MKVEGKFISLAVLILLLTVPQVSFGKDVYKIGAILPLTGSGALSGNNTRKAAELAVAELNKSTASNVGIVLISEDSKGIGKEGVSVVNKLISIDKINAVLDDAVSSVALAVVPIITENKLPTISTGSTNPKLSGASPYFFRLWNSDLEEAVISAKFIASDLKFNKGVILYIRNEYGDGLQGSFEKEFAKYKGKIVGKESFEAGAANYRDQLLKLKALKPQFVYLVGYPVEIPRVLVEMKKLKFTAKIVTTAAIEDNSVLEQAKIASEGVIYPFAKPAKSKMTESFKQEYKRKFGEDPGSPAAEAYDAIMIFAKAFGKVGADGTKVKDYIANIKHEGVSGLIILDKNGDVHKPMEMKIIRNGKFEVLKK